MRSGRLSLESCDAQNLGHKRPHAVRFPIRSVPGAVLDPSQGHKRKSNHISTSIAHVMGIKSLDRGLDYAGWRLIARQLRPSPVNPECLLVDQAMAQHLRAEAGDTAGLADEMALV